MQRNQKQKVVSCAWNVKYFSTLMIFLMTVFVSVASEYFIYLTHEHNRHADILLCICNLCIQWKGVKYFGNLFASKWIKRSWVFLLFFYMIIATRQNRLKNNSILVKRCGHVRLYLKCILSVYVYETTYKGSFESCCQYPV